MKKLITIAVYVLISCVIVSAQTTTTTTTTQNPEGNQGSSSDFKSCYIGGRVLATVTSLRLKSSDNSTLTTDFVVGYGGGGVLGVNFTKNIGSQIEVLYSSLSQEYKDPQGFNHKLNIKYVNIPLLFMLNTDVSKGLNLNIGVGPQLGINTGSSINKESTGEPGVDSVHAVLAVKKGDVGFAYGFGLDFMLSEYLKLNMGYRGVKGLVDISDDSKNTTTNDYYILDRAHVNTNSVYAGLSILF